MQFCKTIRLYYSFLDLARAECCVENHLYYNGSLVLGHEGHSNFVPSGGEELGFLEFEDFAS